MGLVWASDVKPLGWLVATDGTLRLMGLVWASDEGFDTFLSHHKEYRSSSGILLLFNGNWRIKYDRRFCRYLGRARTDVETR
jgi:hypothetical protein